MKTIRASVVFTMAILLLVSAGGCSDGGGGKIEPPLDKSRAPELSGKAVVFGQVVSSDTGLGIAKANVKISIGNTSTLTTTTYAGKDAVDKQASKIPDPQFEKTKTTKTPLGDVGAVEAQLGTFSIEAVPAGKHKIEISADGFATFGGTIDVPTHTDIIYVPASNNADSIKLPKGFDAKVVVTADGKPLPNVPVYVQSPKSLYNVYYSELLPEIQVTTDASGAALFKGLPQDGYFTLTVPAQDLNSDGDYEFGTYSSGLRLRYQGKDTLWSAALPKLLPGEELKVIATSCNAYPGLIGNNAPAIYSAPIPFGDVCGTTKRGPISVVFNRPIEMKEFAKSRLEAFNVSSPTWRKEPQSPEKVSTDLKVALQPDNVVLTMTPEADLTENYVYSLLSSNAVQISYTLRGKLMTVMAEDITDFPVGFYVVPEAGFDMGAIALDLFETLPIPKELTLKLPAVASGTVTVTKYSTNAGKNTYELKGQTDNNIKFDPVTIQISNCTMNADHGGVATPPDKVDNTVRCQIPFMSNQLLLLPKDFMEIVASDKMTLTFALTDSFGKPITGTKELTIQSRQFPWRQGGGDQPVPAP